MVTLWKEMGDLVPWDVEKAEVPNHFFASIFTNKNLTTPPKLKAGTGRMKNKEDKV